jgi:hypothetical protein
MAAPNIVNVSTITAKSSGVSLTGTGATLVVNNATNSSTVLKVNVINVANTTGNACPVSVGLYSLAGLGGTTYPVVSSVSIPGNSTLTVVDKGTAYYVEENQSIGAIAGIGGALVVTISYEIIG